ncbi:MAG: Ig-like domain-containing protein [Chloroflexota bacterium]
MDGARRLSDPADAPGRLARRMSIATAASAIAFIAALVAAGPGTAPPAVAVSLLAAPDTLTIVHDRTTTVPAPGVLKNDVTVLGTSAVLDSQPSHGSVLLSANGGYKYDPDPGFVGGDVFKYHDFDGLLPTNTTTVTITITNARPVARSDRWSANAGRRETVGAPGVLENDDDADGDALQAKLVSGPGHGTVTFGADGGFAYTADPGFDGDDVFMYTASDGIANSAAATVTMNVSASGSTPRPSITATPTPIPTATPTPLPLPLPTVSLPPIPLPTVSLPPLPLPTPRVTPTPDPRATPSPGATPSPTPASTRPPDVAESSPMPTPSGAAVPGSRGEAGGGPGDGIRPGAGAGGGTVDGPDSHRPVFSIAGEGPTRVVPIIGADLAGFDGLDWAVPALTLTVPGMLLILAVLAQLSASAIWLPVARRWLGAFGVGRRRRRHVA